MIQKYLETIKISISQHLAYRLNFVLNWTGPALVYFFIKYNVWTGIYGGVQSDLNLRGYTLAAMLEYQAWTFIVILLAHSYNGATQEADIRLGRISSYLLYPFSFFEHNVGRFLGFLTLQSFIVATSFVFFLGTGFVSWISWSSFFAGFILSVLAAFFWFLWNFLTSITAFWLEEAWFLRVGMILLTRLLSGSLIPLVFFPDTLQYILALSPFPYLTYYPTRVFLGDTEHFLPAFLAISTWILFMGLVIKILWQRGIRRYTGAGI